MRVLSGMAGGDIGSGLKWTSVVISDTRLLVAVKTRRCRHEDYPAARPRRGPRPDQSTEAAQ